MYIVLIEYHSEKKNQLTFCTCCLFFKEKMTTINEAKPRITKQRTSPSTQQFLTSIRQRLLEMMLLNLKC